MTCQTMQGNLKIWNFIASVLLNLQTFKVGRAESYPLISDRLKIR